MNYKKYFLFLVAILILMITIAKYFFNVDIKNYKNQLFTLMSILFFLFFLLINEKNANK
jgi:hypothetical protein